MHSCIILSATITCLIIHSPILQITTYSTAVLQYVSIRNINNFRRFMSCKILVKWKDDSEK